MLEKCRHLGRFWHVPAQLGGDTCQRLWYESYGPNLDAGMCWHVSAHGKVPTRVNTKMCLHLSVGTFAGVAPSHVLTHGSKSLHPNMVLMIGITGVGTCQHLDVSAVGTCWHVSAPSQLSTPLQVLSHASTSQHPNEIHMSACVGT